MKLDGHKKRLCWSESILQGACPCLPQTTVERHVVVQRLLPLPQLLRNVVEKPSRDLQEPYILKIH